MLENLHKNICCNNNNLKSCFPAQVRGILNKEEVVMAKASLAYLSQVGGWAGQ